MGEGEVGRTEVIGWQGGREEKKSGGRNWTRPGSGTDLEGGAGKWGKRRKVKMASEGGQAKNVMDTPF